MGNFEALYWNFSSSINLFFLKSEVSTYMNEEEEVFLEDTDNITKKNLTCNFRQLT